MGRYDRRWYFEPGWKYPYRQWFDVHQLEHHQLLLWSINNGTIQIGSSKELVITTSNAGRYFQISAPIVDSTAGPSGVTIDEIQTTQMQTAVQFTGGVSTYTGPTILDAGMDCPFVLDTVGVGGSFGNGGAITFNGGGISIPHQQF